MLEITNLDIDYHGAVALSAINMRIDVGELVSLVGSNGAGKSSLLAAVSGLHRPISGRIVVDGHDITHTPAHRVTAHGVSLVPEGRRLFARQTVYTNLVLGAYRYRDRQLRAQTLHQVFELFPILHQRLHLPAHVLSGGEQQMLALGRALMSQPRLLLLDEPSMGIAPKLAATIFQAISDIRHSGITVLLVEQNLRAALRLSDRVYVLQNGSIIRSGRPDQLRQSSLIRRAYLGL